jgi:hypothetical protein
MRALRNGIALAAVASLVWACAAAEPVTDEDASPNTIAVEEPTTSLPVITPTQPPTTTSTPPLEPVELVRNGDQVLGRRNGETVFVVTRDLENLALGDDLVMWREPDGLLSDLGRHGSVWYLEEVVMAGENTPGVWEQWEIHRLWPDQPNIDAVWLTDYSGISGDSEPQYTPKPSDYFTVFDQILLESDHLDSFGIHIDCHYEGEVAAALLSFEESTPRVLIAWRINFEAEQLVEVDNLVLVSIGDCLKVEARY